MPLNEETNQPTNQIYLTHNKYYDSVNNGNEEVVWHFSELKNWSLSIGFSLVS